MFYSRNLLSGKRRYLWGLTLLLVISVICVAFGMTGSNDFDIARREVFLRKIVDEVLTQSADSKSRGLPVKRSPTLANLKAFHVSSRGSGRIKGIVCCFLVVAALRRRIVEALRDLIGALAEPAGLQRGRGNAFAEFAVARQGCLALI